MYYLFDGSYYGFLCCVFESFERKEFNTALTNKENFNGDFFNECRTIYTDNKKAERVQAGLHKKAGKGAAGFYHAFLSEDPKAWQSSFNIILRLFLFSGDILSDYGNSDVLYYTRVVKKVSRERHRTKAFTRFQKSSDGMYVAVIEPDFNVLPLISGFFKNRYADQRWLIYDIKRSYGLLYDLRTISEITITEQDENALTLDSDAVTIDKTEGHFEQLWQRYYKSTTIEARRNIKLHLQHVPKRYWKYLTEKRNELSNGF